MAGFSIRARGRHADRIGSRRKRVVAGLTSAALICGAIGFLASSAQADIYTQGNDNLRTNWNRSETSLSPALVQSSSFGRLFATKLDGQVYAQPVVVGDEVIAVTESNTAYGLDRATGDIKWSKNYGPAWPASAIAGCGDLVPDIGATATPVYDPASNSLYFTTKVDDGTPTHRHPSWLMHAVDPTSGQERSGWPVTIQGTPDNAPGVTFDAFYQQQRPGLLLMDGVVYAGFGAHCDAWPYRGYVVGVSTTKAAITSMWASETGAGVGGAGIWQSGGGLVSDDSGRIFFSTGNGVSPAPGAGTAVQGTLAESVVRLQVGADGKLSTADFFSPSNASTLDLNDQDLSSGAPIGLPDTFGTAAHPHLMVQQGKDGRVFLLDRDNLGGMGQGSRGGDAVVSVSGPYQGMWGHPAVWGGDGGYVYVVNNNSSMRALKYGTDSSGTPILSAVGATVDSFGYTSGSPLVTSNGTVDSTALVWMVSASGGSGANGTLRAYSPLPDSNGVLQLLWSAPIGTAAKFASPTADRGKVYVGTRDGYLYGFGSPATTAVTAAPLDLGQVQVGSSASGTMTLTATQNVSVTGLSASGAFAVTSTVPTSAAPIGINSGQSQDVGISFTPTTTGGVNGTLAVYLSDGQKLVFSLHGVGTRPGLGAAPGTLAFGTVPTGTNHTLNVEFTNTGTADETVDSVSPPSGVFTATGLPAANTVLHAGESFVASVTYTPTTAGDDSGTLTVNSSGPDGSHSAHVTLTGSSVSGKGELTYDKTSLDFGTVPVGTSKALSFTITNTGNLPMTVTLAKAPTGDFNSPSQLSEGLVIGPDQEVVQTVVFTPRTDSAQPTTGYTINAADGTSNPAVKTVVAMTGTGSGSALTTSSQDGTWQANGDGALSSDGGFSLTPSASAKAGSAVEKTAVTTEGLKATFTAQFGPGNGGDGIALSLLDPTANTGSAVGSNGSGLGIAGRPGVVVAFESGWNGDVSAQNFVGVGYSTAGSATIAYPHGVTPLPSSLRQGTHQIDVQVQNGHLLVSVDGVQVLDSTPTLPQSALFSLSAGTSGGGDAHTVSGLVLSATPAPVTDPGTGGSPGPSASASASASVSASPSASPTTAAPTSAKPSSSPTTAPPTPTPVTTGYTPLRPVRALTTRSVASHAKVGITLAGKYGIPSNATSVVLDIGVSGTKAASGTVAVEPHLGSVPRYGAVYWNSATQLTVHSVSVRLYKGAVDVYNGSSKSAPVYVDVLGYYAPKSGRLLTTLRPGYLLSTTGAIGQSSKSALGAKHTLSVVARGRAGVPSTATAVVLNVVVPSPGTTGSLTVTPHGSTRYGAPQLVWNAKGSTTSNLVTVPVGTLGRLDFYNGGSGPVNVLASVVGYYAAGSGKSFTATNPATVLDTRYAIGRSGTSPLASHAVLRLQIAGKGAVPKGATAVLMQIGTVSAAGGGSLGVWPDGQTQYTPASLYWSTGGKLTTTLVAVPLTSNGRIDIRNNGSRSVAVFGSVVGYWTG